jgi:hypothetical protein
MRWRHTSSWGAGVLSTGAGPGAVGSISTPSEPADTDREGNVMYGATAPQYLHVYRLLVTQVVPSMLQGRCVQYKIINPDKTRDDNVQTVVLIGWQSWDAGPALGCAGCRHR